MTNQITREYKGFFDKFIQGGFGLAKTFWLGLFVPSMILNPIISAIFSQSTSFALMLGILALVLVYMLSVLVALWRAAKIYQGLAVWRILVQIIVILNVCSLLFGVFGIFMGVVR